MGKLTRDQADLIDATPIPTAPHGERDPRSPPEDYFVEEVKQQLLDDVRLGDTAQERYNAVFKGGLQIYTTFDPRLQQIALCRPATTSCPTPAASSRSRSWPSIRRPAR